MSSSSHFHPSSLLLRGAAHTLWCHDAPSLLSLFASSFSLFSLCWFLLLTILRYLHQQRGGGEVARTSSGGETTVSISCQTTSQALEISSSACSLVSPLNLALAPTHLQLIVTIFDLSGPGQPVAGRRRVFS